MKKIINNKPRVFVGLSGGVDSAVSAYLLKQQGYDVRGVFMKNFTGTAYDLAGECNWLSEKKDAEAVAKKLKITFEVWDFEREYNKWVVDYFFREYARGHTPNPDVRCNQFVKIPLFLKRALKQGADYIAMGHYARVGESKGKYYLLNGLDDNKDQSYFLYTLNQVALKHLKFPVGEIHKPEVRTIAKKINLPVANKPDSVGICFIGEVKIEDFLKTRLQEKPGDIIDRQGKVVGKHIGLSFYTIGQRHGLGMSGGPWYVIGRQKKSNKLIVGKLTEQKYMYAKTFTINKIITAEKTDFKIPGTYLVRHRYRHPVFKAAIKKRGNKYVVTFQKEQRAITPGQSAVFYKKTAKGLRVMGGGVIETVEKKGFVW